MPASRLQIQTELDFLRRGFGLRLQSFSKIRDLDRGRLGISIGAKPDFLDVNKSRNQSQNEAKEHETESIVTLLSHRSILSVEYILQIRDVLHRQV